MLIPTQIFTSQPTDQAWSLDYGTFLLTIHLKENLLWKMCAKWEFEVFKGIVAEPISQAIQTCQTVRLTPWRKKQKKKKKNWNDSIRTVLIASHFGNCAHVGTRYLGNSVTFTQVDTQSGKRSRSGTWKTTIDTCVSVFKVKFSQG